MQTELKTVDEAFDAVMGKVLGGVELTKQIKMDKGTDPDYSTVLDNFGAFDGVLLACRDQKTREVNVALVGARVLGRLNQRWQGENFQFHYGESPVNKEPGTFDLHFKGNAHNLRLRAWVDFEQGGRRMHRVDIYIEQLHDASTLSGTWCKCC